MTAQPTVHEEAVQKWAPLPEGIDNVRLGEVAAPQRVLVSQERLDRMRAAIRSVLGDIEVAMGIADICPDPLVFALQAGLPRLDAFRPTIDGGSHGATWNRSARGPLYAVSEIAQIARERPRRQAPVRVDYRTRFTDRGGVLVGTATGSSIHVGSVE